MHLSISRTLLLFGVIVSLGLAVSTAVQNHALRELKIDGPAYHRIVDGKDLIADILPPPLFLVEAYMLATEGTLHSERAQANLEKIIKLRAQYDDRKAYWAASNLDNSLKKELAEQVLHEADQFWVTIDEKLKPAVAQNDHAAMHAMLDQLMDEFYQHQASVNTLVANATTYLEQSEVQADERSRFLSTAALLAAGLSVVLFVAGLMFFRSRAVVPLDSMKSYMGLLAAGDYSKEVPFADRADEIGAMSQAVAIFRENAVERQQNRLRDEAAKQREHERERAQVLTQAAADQERQDVIRQLTDGLEHLSAGQLDYRIEALFPEGYEKLRLQFNASLETLYQSMGEISSTTDAVRNSATEIAQATGDLAKRTEQQAATIEETAAALEQITATVKNSADRAQEASGKMADTKSGAERSSAVMREAIAAMEKIAGSSSQIGQIINVIDEIAFQTNLLALNAGVEAARAGEAGRGFAVVAQEVRELASRSANAAKEIKSLISASASQVATGVDLVNRTGTALGEIETNVRAVTDLIGEIVTASSEQATAIGEINAAVNHMDQVTQHNAAMAEQTNTACRGLKEEAHSLETVVGRFQTGNVRRTTPQASRPLVPRTEARMTHAAA